MLLELVVLAAGFFVCIFGRSGSVDGWCSASFLGVVDDGRGSLLLCRCGLGFVMGCRGWVRFGVVVDDYCIKSAWREVACCLAVSCKEVACRRMRPTNCFMSASGTVGCTIVAADAVCC